MATSYSELRAMTIEQLEARYDGLAPRVSEGLNFYREEIARRYSEAATDEIVRLTRTIRSLTWAVAVLTVANVVLVALSLFL